MSKNNIWLYVILDGSGSMSGVNDDVNGGVNQFISDQRDLDDDDTFLSLTVFDTNVRKIYTDEPITEVEDVDRGITLMGGMTALLDAIGKTLSDARGQNHPGKKLVLIYTDGHENASTEWTNEGVKTLIKELEDSGDWTFTFMSAGIDNFTQAQALGIAKGNYAFVANTGAATLDSMSRMSQGTTSLRSDSAMASAAFYSDLAPEDVSHIEPSNVVEPKKKKAKS